MSDVQVPARGERNTSPSDFDVEDAEERGLYTRMNYELQNKIHYLLSLTLLQILGHDHDGESHWNQELASSGGFCDGSSDLPHQAN